jgi:hypothetical protein
MSLPDSPFWCSCSPPKCFSYGMTSPADVTPRTKSLMGNLTVNSFYYRSTDIYQMFINLATLFHFSRWLNAVLSTIVRIQTKQDMLYTNSRRQRVLGGSGFVLWVWRGPTSKRRLTNLKLLFAKLISHQNAIARKLFEWQSCQEEYWSGKNIVAWQCSDNTTPVAWCIETNCNGLRPWPCPWACNKYQYY